MKIEWNFSEFEKFGDRVQDITKFEAFAKQMISEITVALREALFQNTPVLTGNLCANWGGDENYSFAIKQFAYGFSVTLYNRASSDKSPKYPNFQYGLAVNDGHRTPGGNGWVMGRFFVEKSIVQTAESSQIESIVMTKLQKWWDSV